MHFTTTDKTVGKPDFYISRPAEGRVKWEGGNSSEELSTFTFDQMAFSLDGGQQFLHLRKPLLLKINKSKLSFEVTDWGIEMDCLRLAELPHALTRRFLKLLSAAENESLSEREQAEWLAISDYLDFKQFSIDRSSPRYMEGVLRSRTEVIIVEWHDGSRETLDWNVGKALSDVEPGERFSARVKLGKDDHALNIRNVSLLKSPEDSLQDWESWPQKS